jgi:hypothetical protein
MLQSGTIENAPPETVTSEQPPDSAASGDGAAGDGAHEVGYGALLEDAVDAGAGAVQAVQESFTSRPYDVIEAVPGLGAPTRAVRTLHFAAIRATYATIRQVNHGAGAAWRWAKRGR